MNDQKENALLDYIDLLILLDHKSRIIDDQDLKEYTDHYTGILYSMAQTINES